MKFSRSFSLAVSHYECCVCRVIHIASSLDGSMHCGGAIWKRWFSVGSLPSPACTAAVPTQLCHFLPGTLPLRLRVGTETLLLRRATPFLSSLGQVFVNKLLELCRNEWKDLGLSVYSLQLWNNRCWFAFHLKYSLEGKH